MPQKQDNSDERYHSNFYWKEIFNDSNGKTSAGSFIGVVAGIISILMFVVLICFYFLHLAQASIVLELIDKATTYFMISASLLGVRSITAAFRRNKFTINNQVQDQLQPQPQQIETESQEQEIGTIPKDNSKKSKKKKKLFEGKSSKEI